MNLPHLGSLHPDKEIPEWLVSDPVAVPYFDGKPLPFCVDGLGPADEPELIDAIECFLSLGSEGREAATPYLFKNYERITSMLAVEDWGCWIDNPGELWNYVKPRKIYISRRHRRDKLLYVQIVADCEWEWEHGLQIIYRRGAVLSRVSDEDGHLTYSDAYNVPDDQDKIDG